MARKRRKSREPAKPSKAESDSVKSPVETGKEPLLSGQSMSRMASLVVLIVIIAISMLLFYKVMAAFILPLFLAALFAVIFRPIHRRMLTKFKDRQATAAGLTTGAILCIVLLPMIGVTALAVYQGFKSYTEFDRAGFRDRLRSFGTNFIRERPFENEIVALDSFVVSLPDKIPSLEEVREGQIFTIDLETARRLWSSIQREYDRIALSAGHPPDLSVWDIAKEDHTNTAAVKRLKNSGALTRKLVDENAELDAADQPPIDEQEFVLEFSTLNKLINALELADTYFRSNSRQTERGALNAPLADPPLDAKRPGVDPILENVEILSEAAMEAPVSREPLNRDEQVLLHNEFPKVKAYYLDVRESIHGGILRMLLTDFFFSTDEQFAQGEDYVSGILKRSAPSVTGQATSIITQLVVGICIMVLGIFYFLKDGPGMIRAVMKLSPLDDRYELELLTEFDSVSRAVVLAMLLSALAQGLLAGIGYYLAFFLLSPFPDASLGTVFLLTILTTLMSMVPVVGAGAVWIPACLWLAIVEGRITAAIVLAIYGAGIVSMADNVIKPMVLHGQSNLHPLLALLSVLGGVAALGPIGIIVGPMSVAFLQAVLNMLHREIKEFDNT